MTTIAVFVPCYVQAVRPRDAEHVSRVLDALGVAHDVVRAGCCGQPAFNSGFRAEATRVGRSWLRRAREYETVVVPSSSCTAMARNSLPGLFEGSRAAGAEAIAGRTMEFSQFVAEHERLGELPLVLRGSVTFHDACHSRREIQTTEHALRLLEAVEGLEVRRLALEDECCGFGGTFTAKYPEVSAAMGSTKLDDVGATGARVLVSTDVSCLTHLQSLAGGDGRAIETWSIAELLSRALP